jgi:hypothetical protein
MSWKTWRVVAIGLGFAGLALLPVAALRKTSSRVDAAIDAVVGRVLEEQRWNRPGSLPSGQPLRFYVHADEASLDDLAERWHSSGLNVEVSGYEEKMREGPGVLKVWRDADNDTWRSIQLTVILVPTPGGCSTHESWRASWSPLGWRTEKIGAMYVMW